MPKEDVWISRFYIYTKELPQFIEYCKRSQCIEELAIKFVLDKDSSYEEGQVIYKDGFVGDVTHHSEKDSLKFINVFSLFFTLSKYCMRL